jgi:phage terminase large subunit-like protein
MKAKHPNVHAGIEWAKGVISGRHVACRYVRLACQRHFDDLERARDKTTPWVFDPQAAERALEFIQLLPHAKGEWAFKRQLITLEPWQKFGLACTFGWKRRKDGKRRFRESYWEVSRKNGKSVIAAGVALTMFCIDGEFGAEVYSGATTEKQAWEVFRPARLMVKRSPQLVEAAGIEVNASNLNRPADGSRFEPLIGDPGDGSSPSCAIIDEYHEHQTARLYETMLTGMGARKQPLMFIITTAGFDTQGPCYDKRRQLIEALEGSAPDDELFGWVFTIDEGDDWASPDVLAKANPNMGVSVYQEYLISQQQKAVKNASFQNTFKTKHLNVWVTARSAYFNMESWRDCEDKTLNLEDFEGQECWMALDLASKTDICARINLFSRDIGGKRHYYSIEPRFYLPDDTIQYGRERSMVERYQRWVNEGYLTATDGAEVDFGQVEAELLADSQRFAVREVPHDPWGAFQIAHRLEDAGLVPVKIPQQTQHLSPPMKELNAAILSGRFHHDGNPVLTWMMGNVTAKEDANENVFPRKERNESKIDGAVALIMGINRAMVAEAGADIDDFLCNIVVA